MPPWQLSSTWFPTHRESEGETDVGVTLGVGFLVMIVLDPGGDTLVDVGFTLRVELVGLNLLNGEDEGLLFVLEDLVVGDNLLEIELWDGFKEFDVLVLIPEPVLDAVSLDVELPVFVAVVK